ncbi:hypothetical protein HID58_059638 [Brassica napus]|uniref:Uncharacterized protein n=1 Tax=Brassica napus TaxID=3708 RepID=A0ABQ7ZTG2_BRANA|nr:hypothetical protein HID58_059638 [Brassica napus]
MKRGPRTNPVVASDKTCCFHIVLSKRWRSLLSLVDKLDLREAIGDPRGFSAFVDTTLALLTNSSIIKRFSLNCEHRHDKTRVETYGFALCWSEAASWSFTWRACVCISPSQATRWSSSRYQTGFYLSGLPPPNGGVFFPNLKTLSLVSVGFHPCEVYEYLISGCPLLEELFMRWMVVSQSIAVSSPCIKRLAVSCHFRGYWEPPASEDRVLDEDGFCNGFSNGVDGGWVLQLLLIGRHEYDTLHSKLFVNLRGWKCSDFGKID